MYLLVLLEVDRQTDYPAEYSLLPGGLHTYKLSLSEVGGRQEAVVGPAGDGWGWLGMAVDAAGEGSVGEGR